MGGVEKPKTLAVVGAGIVGVCCALNLQKKGFVVTLIDRAGVAQGCSKGNAGHFATEQVFPLAHWSLLSQLPKMLFDPLGPISIRLSYLPQAMPWFIRFMCNMLPGRFKRNTAALQALNVNAIAALSELLAEAGIADMLIPNGSLLTFESINIEVVKKVQVSYQSHGVNVKLFNLKQARELEPSLGDNINHVLFFPDVGHTADPEMLCAKLFQHFIEQGGQFLKTSVLGIVQKDHCVGINTGVTTLEYSKCVIAAGAWSKCLVTPLGYKLPLETERGYHLMLKQHPKLNRPIASYERKMIMTPMTAGLRLAGTVEFGGLLAKAKKKRAMILGDHSVKLLKDLKLAASDEQDYWMGMRPSLPDSLPVIGQAPRHEGIYFALGHQHLGLTQAAITGKILSDKVAEHANDFDLSPFCISRFD